MLCIPWFRQCTSRKNGLSQTFSFPWKGKKCLWCGYREERFVSQHPDLRILADLHRKEKRADFTIPSFIIQFNQIQSNIYTTSSCMGKSEICNAFISPYMIHDTAFFQRNLMISQYYVDTQEAALLHESQHIPDAILQVQRKTFANIFTNRQSSVACRKCVPVEVADDGSEQKIQAGKSHRGFGNGSWFRTDSAN